MDADLEQLMTLREMTRKTGLLHDAQVFQLKMYPLALTNATKVSIEYDYDKKNVIFNIIETQGRAPKEIKKKLDLICQWTKTLLGEEYSVKIKTKNKVLYGRSGNRKGETGKEDLRRRIFDRMESKTRAPTPSKRRS